MRGIPVSGSLGGWMDFESFEGIFFPDTGKSFIAVKEEGYFGGVGPTRYEVWPANRFPEGLAGAAAGQEIVFERNGPLTKRVVPSAWKEIGKEQYDELERAYELLGSTTQHSSEAGREREAAEHRVRATLDSLM